MSKSMQFNILKATYLSKYNKAKRCKDVWHTHQDLQDLAQPWIQQQPCSEPDARGKHCLQCWKPIMDCLPSWQSTKKIQSTTNKNISQMCMRERERERLISFLKRGYTESRRHLNSGQDVVEWSCKRYIWKNSIIKHTLFSYKGRKVFHILLICPVISYILGNVTQQIKNCRMLNMIILLKFEVSCIIWTQSTPSNDTNHRDGPFQQYYRQLKMNMIKEALLL